MTLWEALKHLEGTTLPRLQMRKAQTAHVKADADALRVALDAILADSRYFRVEAAKAALAEGRAEDRRLRAAMQVAIDLIIHLHEQRARAALEAALRGEEPSATALAMIKLRDANNV